MTIYNKTSFEPYYSLVFTEDNIDSLKKGWYEVPLKAVKQVNGVAAQVLIQVAEILGLSDDDTVLKYLLDDDLTVKKCYSVAYMAAENKEVGEKELVLTLGGIPHRLDTFVEGLANKGFIFNADIVETTQNKETKKHPCFSYFQPKTSKSGQMMMPLAKDVVSFEMVAKIKSDEDEQKIVDQELINALEAIRAEEMGIEQLLGADLIQTLGTGQQFDQFAKLKELPFGGYECSPVEHQASKVVKNAKGTHNIGEQFKFIATSLEDNTKYCVNVSVSHQIGQAAKANDHYQKESWFLGVHNHEAMEVAGREVTKVHVVVNPNIKIGSALLNRVMKKTTQPEVKSAQPQQPKQLQPGVDVVMDSVANGNNPEVITVPAQTVNNHVSAESNLNIPF